MDENKKLIIWTPVLQQIIFHAELLPAMTQLFCATLIFLFNDFDLLLRIQMCE